MKHRARIGKMKSQRADQDRHQREQQDLPREIAQIREASHHDRAIHRERRHAQKENDNRIEILRQHSYRSGAAMTLPILMGGLSDSTDGAHAQGGFSVLSEPHETGLRKRPRDEHCERQQQETPAELRQRAGRDAKRLVDGCDERGTAQTADNTRYQREQHNPAGLPDKGHEQGHKILILEAIGGASAGMACGAH
jgi:hypothetical protein